MPLTSYPLRSLVAASAFLLASGTSQAEVYSDAAAVLQLRVGNQRATVGDERLIRVPGGTTGQSAQDSLRVPGANFDFGIAGGQVEGGVSLGRPYASAFSFVDGWPTPEPGALLSAEAVGLGRVNYLATVGGAAGQAGTLTVRGRFAQVAVGASTGPLASSGSVDEMVSVAVSTPGQVRCARPPCFKSDRLYAELFGSGAVLHSLDYDYEFSIAVQAGDRLDLWLTAGARSVNGYNVLVGSSPYARTGPQALSAATSSLPPDDWEMLLSFSNGLGLAEGSGLVAGAGGWSLPLAPVPEAPTWALWLAALALLPRLTRRRRAS